MLLLIYYLRRLLYVHVLWSACAVREKMVTNENLNKSLAKKVYDEQTTKYHKYLGRYQTLSLGRSAPI